MNLDEAGTFVRVNVAAQRARQLMQGAAPKVESRSRKPAAIAMQEVDEGLVEAYAPSELPESLREAAFGTDDTDSDSEDDV